MTTPTGSRRDRTTPFRNQLGMAFFAHFLAKSAGFNECRWDDNPTGNTSGSVRDRSSRNAQAEQTGSFVGAARSIRLMDFRRFFWSDTAVF